MVMDYTVEVVIPSVPAGAPALVGVQPDPGLLNMDAAPDASGSPSFTHRNGRPPRKLGPRHHAANLSDEVKRGIP